MLIITSVCVTAQTQKLAVCNNSGMKVDVEQKRVPVFYRGALQTAERAFTLKLLLLTCHTLPCKDKKQKSTGFCMGMDGWILMSIK